MNDRIYYSREAEMKAQQERLTFALILMALGLGLGAVIALIFAPQSGKITRKVLSEQAEQAYDNSREATSKALDNLQHDFDRLRKEVNERLPVK